MKIPFALLSMLALGLSFVPLAAATHECVQPNRNCVGVLGDGGCGAVNVYNAGTDVSVGCPIAAGKECLLAVNGSLLACIALSTDSCIFGVGVTPASYQYFICN